MSNKIASPADLTAELRQLIAYCEESEPSRTVLAEALEALSARVAGEDIVAKEWPSEESRQKYLREHPRAKPEKHTVKKAPEGKKEPEKKEPEGKKEFNTDLGKVHRKPMLPGEARKWQLLRDDSEGKELSSLFQNLDSRKDRLKGLENAKRYLDVYKQQAKNPEEWKANFSKAIDELIEKEKKDPKPVGTTTKKTK